MGLGTRYFQVLYACLSMYDDLDSLSHLLFSPLTLCGPHDATDQLVIMEKTDDLLSVWSKCSTSSSSSTVESALETPATPPCHTALFTVRQSIWFRSQVSCVMIKLNKSKRGFAGTIIIFLGGAGKFLCQHNVDTSFSQRKSVDGCPRISWSTRRYTLAEKSGKIDSLP